jgi:hypothetical protein
MWRGLVRVQVIGAAGAILLARSVVADDWPYYQHDAWHTGNSGAFVNPQALSLAWTAPSSPTGYSTPVIVGNTIYAMQNQGGNGNSHTTVSSFNLSTGAINWSYTGDFVFPSQPGVGGGFVTFVGSTISSSSLYVLDALTGTLRYTVPIPEGPTSMMPTVVQDPISGNVTAFVTGSLLVGFGEAVSAVSLGPTSGSVRWTFTGEFGGASIPTVVGRSIVLAGPGQYYAFDQATPAMNHFWSGAISGGGGTTVAYDAARHQFYVLEYYNGPTPTLSAFHYTDNAHITLLWQRTGTGVGDCNSVAIGPTGNVYSAGNSVIWELDPTTGATLRSIPGSFASCVTPALTNNVLWIIGTSQVFAYDLLTLQLLRAFHPSRGDLNTPYKSPGAFADGYFVVDYNGIRGFDVYRAPSPTPRFDFNRDGKQDYLLYNPSTRQTAVWYLNNNVFIGGAFGLTLPVGWRVIDAADFNRDGRPDYALFNASTRQTAIWYLSGVKGVTFIGSAWGPRLPSGWALVATGDFNNDGKADFVIFNASTRQTAIWYLNNNVFIGGAFGPSIPSPWSLVGIAEFSSDGKPDYLLFNPNTHASVIWYLSGASRVGSAFGPTIAAGYNLTGAADFNRDYKPDYALFNASTGQSLIWYLSNNVYRGSANGPTLSAGWSLIQP